MATNADDNAQLRSQLRGVEGVAAEDTRSELLEHAREARLNVVSFDQAKGTRVLEATDDPDIAVARYVEESRKDFGKLGGPGSYIALTDAQGRLDAARLSEGSGVTRETFGKDEGRAAVEAALDLRREREQREASTRLAAQAAEDSKTPKARADVADEAGPPNHYGAEAQEQHAKEIAARRAADTAPPEYNLREQMAKVGAELRNEGDAGRSEPENSVDVQRSGRELARDELILPRRIAQNYNEVDGKFFAKDSNRVMFEDKGAKLATSSTDKGAIADMVAYAKAKQWDSLKLTGSQEFRREAWLQAESQGIKTQGYTPKAADLAALQTLTQERSTNAITPLQERKRDVAPRAEPVAAAPRHDLNKNQAAMHADATKNLSINMQELQKRPSMKDTSVEDLTKLAYWRGMVREENKGQPQPVQDEAVARFDKQAEDPQFLKRLDQETKAGVQDKTTDRVQKRDTHEQSL